jgi:hypothetical protein
VQNAKKRPFCLAITNNSTNFAEEITNLVTIFYSWNKKNLRQKLTVPTIKS